MKIAYLVLAHKDPAFLERVTRKLTQDTKDHVFIHVDKKTDITEFKRRLSDCTSCTFVEHRVPVFWAGYSSVMATIKLFRLAVKQGGFDRYVILQGLDYPILSNKEIHAFFEENTNVEFIRAVNETKTGDMEDLRKYCAYWFHDKKGRKGSIINRIKQKLQNKTYADRKNHRPAQAKKPYVRCSLRRLDVFRGWAHFAVTREAVEYILKFHARHPLFNLYFRTCYASDESYFHTIIYNSHFIDRTPEGTTAPDHKVVSMLNVTYFEYPDIVTVFSKKEDYQRLKDSGKLFFRKVTSESSELLDYIDEQHRTCVNREHM